MGAMLLQSGDRDHDRGIPVQRPDCGRSHVGKVHEGAGWTSPCQIAETSGKRRSQFEFVVQPSGCPHSRQRRRWDRSAEPGKGQAKAWTTSGGTRISAFRRN